MSRHRSDGPDGIGYAEQQARPKYDPYATTLGGGYGVDFAPWINDVFVLAWQLGVLVFKLVTWPLRWGWKKSRGTVLQ